ncbi:hypothetical protein E3G52_000285 [Mycobacteroides abscessus]|nr:hypothetical protein [Mycobacteroides abscessus]MBE5453421.1 hypothetical protein [Mycobacteroides abscessus]
MLAPRWRRILFGVQPTPEPKPSSPHPIWDELTTKHGTPDAIWKAAA